jgi:hypothetical protein
MPALAGGGGKSGRGARSAVLDANNRRRGPTGNRRHSRCSGCNGVLEGTG